MKKILSALLLACVSLFAEMEWNTAGYEAALEQAAKEKKMVMVMLSREGCDACWYMENVVFENDDVVDEVLLDFVPVYIDIHKDFVPEGLGYIGTPTFHFLKADGTKIDRLNGGANVRDFTDFIRGVKKKI